MKRLKPISLVILLLLIAHPCFAGLDFFDKDIHKLKYEVKGEIEVKPNKTVFPIIITTKEESYKESLKQAEHIISALNKELKKLDPKIYSLSPFDFFKPDDRGKKSVDLSFFGSNEATSKTKIVSYLYVTFDDKHTFWERSKYVAEALDFFKAFSNKYKKDDNKTVFLEKAFYEIENVEQYREEIVKSVYKKAKLMVQTIANQEKVKPKIKYVSFDQKIKEDIINFSKAYLTINAVIEHTFE